MEFPDGELSILIVDDLYIAELNQKYLHKSGPTNVISFSMREGEYSNINPQLLGDVVISADTAAKEAQEEGIPMMKRLLFLLIHGILHLFGYDHEQSEQEAERMRAKEIELMKKLEDQMESAVFPPKTV